METMLIQNRTKRTEAETLRNYLIRNGVDLSFCRICKDKIVKPYIHHIDGNKLNNNLFNLLVLCSYCHFAIHFKPISLLQRNLGNKWNNGVSKSEEHKKKISLAKKGKTYKEIYGIESAILKRTNHSKFMKNEVNNYKRDKKGRFLK